MKPLVSILIPCYNAERWVAETLQSALTQTWPNTEIILVDDGSKDQSLAIAQSFASPKVHIIAQANRGSSAARNCALQAAQGDFIQYLDADDLLSPHKIEQQVHLLQQQSPGLLATCGSVHFRDGEPPENGYYRSGLPFLTDSDDPADWLIRLWGWDGHGGMADVGSWLTPRAVINQAGPWNETLCLDDDGEYFARVVLASQGIRRSDQARYYYRKHPSTHSLSGQRSQAHHESALSALDLKRQHLMAKTQDPRASKALARAYQEWAMTAYPDYPNITQRCLQRVQALGGTPSMPSLGGWRMELLRKMVGWKAAKQMNQFYQAMSNIQNTSHSQ